MTSLSPIENNQELRDKIMNILAPPVHIDHQNVRPHTIGYTELGVELTTDKLMSLISKAVVEARINERENMKFIDNDGKELFIPYTQYRYVGDGLILSWDDRTTELQSQSNPKGGKK